MRIPSGKLIPRDDGKRIEEFVGAAHTQTLGVSIARMLAPPGWREPAQQPEFDEAVLVLKGALTLIVDGKRERIEANEVGWVEKGARVIYRNDGDVACDYYSICTPAFLPDLAHMEPAEPRREASVVRVEALHPQGGSHRRRLQTLARRYLARLAPGGAEVSVALVTDRAIQTLNRTWRKKNKPTDVLSFPAGDAPLGTPGPKLLGDVILSLDTARRQAKEHGRTVDEELARYLAHGLLHLLGHDHERADDAQRMAAQEDLLLGAAGMVRTAARVDAPPAKRRAIKSGQRKPARRASR